MTYSSQQNVSFRHFYSCYFQFHTCHSCYVQGGRLIQVKITKKHKHRTATKNRPVFENAVTGIWDNCTLLEMGSWFFLSEKSIFGFPKVYTEHAEKVTNTPVTYFFLSLSKQLLDRDHTLWYCLYLFKTKKKQQQIIIIKQTNKQTKRRVIISHLPVTRASLSYHTCLLALRSDEGLTLETSSSESLYGGQFTLSTQLIKPNYLATYSSGKYVRRKTKNLKYLKGRLKTSIIPREENLSRLILYHQ